MEKWPRWLAGWLAGWNAIFTQLSKVNRLAVWLAGCLAGWLAGGVLSCVRMVNHFERVFTWLSEAKSCFSKPVLWVFTILRNNFLEVFKAQSRLFMGFLVENVCAGGLASWLAVVEFRAFRTCFHVALRRKFVMFQCSCMGFHNSKYSFSLGFQSSQQVLCVFS